MPNILKRIIAKTSLPILNLTKKVLFKFKSRDAFFVGDNQSLTKLASGQIFFVDTQDISVSPSILLYGQWEPWITKLFMKVVEPGMTVIDVGSHMGYYTVLAGSKVGQSGKVYSFEANPKIFKVLFKNVFVNGLLDIVHIENKAVYSQSKLVTFNTLKTATGGSSLIEFTDGFKAKFLEEVTPIEVLAVSLDDYFAETSTKVDIIKVDAEGSEQYVFDGMKKILHHNPSLKVFCEFDKGLISGSGCDPRNFLELLVKYGFKLEVIDRESNLLTCSVDELLQIGRADLFLSRDDA
jgi:FkbM family methyltransferase